MSEDEIDKAIGERLEKLVETLSGEATSSGGEKLGSVQFAKKILIDPSRFSKIKTGSAGLQTQNLFHMVKVFGVNLNWLISGDGEMILPVKVKAAAVPVVIKIDSDKLEDLRASLDVLGSVFSLAGQKGERSRSVEEVVIPTVGSKKPRQLVEKKGKLRDISGHKRK